MLGRKFYSAKNAEAGDIITFVDEGAWVSSQFKKEDGSQKNNFQITVKVDGEEMYFNVNKTNSDVLVAAFGNDTKKWIGRKALVKIKLTEVAGKDVEAVRLSAVIDEEAPVQKKKKSASIDPSEDPNAFLDADANDKTQEDK